MSTQVVKRVTFHLIWRRDLKAWGLKQAKTKTERAYLLLNQIYWGLGKDAAIKLASAYCRLRYRRQGTPTQLKIHRKRDNTIEAEYTYPKSSDPKKYRG